MKFKFSFLLVILTILISAQSGSINVNVFDEFTKKPLAATIKIEKLQQEFSGNGNVNLSGLPSGTYNLEMEAEGYDSGFLN